MVATFVTAVASRAENIAFPEAVREGVLHLVTLAQRGVVQDLVERVRVQRTGFMGVDGLAYLILYASMTTRGAGGLRAVWSVAGAHSTTVAAIIGRSKLASSSAMSRLLAGITLEEVHAFSRWLLVHASGALDVMRTSISSVRDGQGRPLRLFAFDPVRIAVRWRGCPEGEDLPPVRRRSEELVAPGHVGRKRGEAVVSMGVVEDVGTGAVLDVTVSRGNGDGGHMFGRAVDAVVQTMSELGQPLSASLLVSDGEFGWVPFFTECLAKNLPFLTRCSRYELLDRADVRSRLAQGPWERVHDSGSGPTRWAVELGTIELEPGRDTFREDGTRYEPVNVRLVASRYEAAVDGPGRGVQLGDQRIELFGSVGVASSSLSAGDVVTTFYARCGQENSFLQHQKLGVHRVLSNNLAGQLFAVVAGLFVWNLRLAAGVQLSPPLPEPAPSKPRVTDLGAPMTLSPLPTPEKVSPSGEIPSLAHALSQVDWTRQLRDRVGWTWNSADLTLITPEGVALHLRGVERHKNRRKLRFIARVRPIQSTVNVPEDVGVLIATALHGEPPRVRTAPASKPMLSPDDEPLPPLAIGWPALRCAAVRNHF